MKNLKAHLLIFISAIIIFLILIFGLVLISYNEIIQNFYHEFTLYFEEPVFPLYIRLAIVISLIISIILLHKKSKLLKKEIEERKQIERELLEKGKKLETFLALSSATLEATADGILVVGKNRKIVVYNQRFVNMWQIPPKILIPGKGKEIEKFVLKQLKNPAKFIKSLDRFYNSEPETECKDEIEFKDGRIFERYTIPQMQGSKIIGRVFSFRDVTQRKEMEEQLIHQATHDTLTSLPNRVLLDDRIQQALVSYKRTHKIAGLLFFDLDGFKLVNDTLGHDFGDNLLRSVATRLESCVRKQDTVARWGGDEFVIILTSLSKEEDILPIVHKCLEVVGESFILENHTVNVTTSVGISILPKDGETPSLLLKKADSAMQYAKNAGRNDYKFYTEKMDNK
jgi:diguanylate cyclase (GGDEF)-like protein